MLRGFCLKAGFVDINFKAEVTLKEISIVDYTKSCTNPVAVSYASNSIKVDQTSLSKILSRSTTFDGNSSINMKGRVSLAARDVDYASNSFIELPQTSRDGSSRASRASLVNDSLQSSRSSVITQGPILMDNVHLEKRSETFIDDVGETVSKRCFVLLCGSGDNVAPNYFSL
jgi:hypothetical protein